MVGKAVSPVRPMQFLDTVELCLAIKEEKLRRIEITLIINLAPSARRDVHRSQIDNGISVGNAVAQNAFIIILHATCFDRTTQAGYYLFAQQLLAQ